MNRSVLSSRLPSCSRFLPAAGTLFLALFLFASLSGCYKYRAPQKPEGYRSALIYTKEYTDWVYFSFEAGEVVPEPEDFRSDPGWDLAFHRWDVRTNGGESGGGEGGAFRTESTVLDFETLYKMLVLSVNKIVPDTLVKTYMSRPDMSAGAAADQQTVVPASKVLGKWMTVEMSVIPPSYRIDERVYLVRTAAGRYAAVKFTDYTDDKGVSGYAGFDYIYPLD